MNLIFSAMSCEAEMIIFNKSPLNIELVEIDPLHAIANVFDSIDFDCLRTNVCRWFHAAIVNGNHVYEEDTHRNGLQAFFVELELLLEAIFVMHRNVLSSTYDSLDDPENIKRKRLYLDKVYLLSSDQAQDPDAVIKAFFSRFSMVYIRRELRDWLQAGIDLEGCDQIKLNPIKVLLVHNDVECLLEAAYHYNKRVLKQAKEQAIAC
jgi:hypothetical protein